MCRHLSPRVGFLAADSFHVACQVVFRQDQLEGDFRFVHAHVRAHAESIALHRGGPVELDNAASALEAVLHNQFRLNLWRALTNTMT